MSNVDPKSFVVGLVDQNGRVRKVIKESITAADLGTDYEVKIWADLISDGKPGEVVQTVKIPIGTGSGPPPKKNPISNFVYSPNSDIKVGDLITLDGSDSTDPDGSIVGYLWSATDNVIIQPSNQSQASFVYPDLPQVNVTLQVTDNDGLTGTRTAIIKKGVIIEPGPEGLVRIMAFADNDVNDDADAVNQKMISIPNVSLFAFVGDGPYSESGTGWVNMMKRSFDDKKDRMIWSRGNHDTNSSESWQTQEDMEEWFPETKSTIGDRTWISSRQVGNVFVISMDTEDLDVEFPRDQFDFVKRELEKAKILRTSGQIDWIVVLFHKPFFTLKSSHSPYTAVRFQYKDIFRDAQVDFCISGHNHNTQLWLPMIPNQSTANGEGSQLFTLMPDGKTFDFSRDHGALFIVTGHGAHEWNSINDSGTGVRNVMHYRDSGEFGFTQLDFNGKKATVYSIDVTGRIHYEYNVSRGENTPPEPKAIAEIDYVPLRPLEGQRVNVDGTRSKASTPSSIISTYTWSSPHITGIEFEPETNFSKGSFIYPVGIPQVDLTLKVVDSLGKEATKTVNIRKFVQEPLNAEAELLVNGRVGETIILNGSRSTGPIVRHEWLRESPDAQTIQLEPALGNWSDKFVATADMVGKDIKFRLRVFDGQGNSNDDVSGTQVTIINIPTGNIDQNGLQWLVARGTQTVIDQTRDQATDDRWSGNVTGLRNGMEATMIAKSIGIASGGHFAMKHGGGNHSGSGASSQRWYDTGLRSTGEIQLQWEGPHPSNHDFTIPDSKWFIKNIGKALEGNWIGLKWVLQTITPNGSPSNGGVRCRLWVDKDPLDANGRPRNNWELVYDFIDGIDAQVISPQSYQMPDEQDCEVRRSDTNRHEIFAGGLHVRRL